MEYIALTILLCVNCLIFGYQLGTRKKDHTMVLLKRIEEDDVEILSVVAEKIYNKISGGCNEAIKSKSRGK